MAYEDTTSVEHFGRQLREKETENKIRGGGLPPPAQARYAAQGQCAVARPNIHQLLLDRINYHTRMSCGLTRLLRSIPVEMPYEAEDALASLILESRPRY